MDMILNTSDVSGTIHIHIICLCLQDDVKLVCPVKHCEISNNQSRIYRQKQFCKFCNAEIHVNPKNDSKTAQASTACEAL